LALIRFVSFSFGGYKERFVFLHHKNKSAKYDTFENIRRNRMK